MQRLRLPFVWPIVLVSLCFAGLCAVTAVSLFLQQTSLSDGLRENVSSQRAATELEECVLDLLALLKDRVESVSALHGRLRLHLDLISRHADQPPEKELAAKLEAGLARYHGLWRMMPPVKQPGHDKTVQQIIRVLERDLLEPCRELEAFNLARVRESTAELGGVMRRLAWGMASVGLLGGVAGVFFGYAVSRALNVSIRRLAVQIRDAAGKIDQAPEIVLTEEGDFQGLHEQVERLTARIERVVEELQQRQREVLRAEQLAAVGQLAAGVAHEVRNPLTAIKMLVQAGLEENGLPVEDLQVIEPEIRRMERSLQTFLDFARPQPAERRVVSVRAVAEQVRGLVQGRAARQRVELDLRLPEQDVTLTADAQQLEQVLINLALNALDAMPCGGRLTIDVRESAGALTLAVTDTGPGITAEMFARLFEPFVSSKPTGVGLGLVISRRIVEDHGGTITAANRPEGGAAVVVTLPLEGSGVTSPTPGEPPILSPCPPNSSE